MELDKPTLQSKKKSAVAVNSQESKSDKSSQSHFEDNRSEAVHQRKLQSFAENSPNNQNSIQLQTSSGVGSQEIAPQKENKTGLPDDLKDGVEDLSGYSMDDVKVHHNSDKPKELNAHAYAQGTDIHLASGQEQHLPHEAWHVVQQKQGRVKPTTQLKGKVPINDDAGLEKEADVMGAKALQTTSQLKSRTAVNSGVNSKLIQRVENKESGENGQKESGFSAQIQQDIIALQGETSFWGWVTNSRFTQIADHVEKYNSAETTEEKRINLLKDISKVAKTYLYGDEKEQIEAHKDDPDSEDHKRRRASLERIVQNIDRFENDYEAAAKALSVVKMEDKIGVGSKLKKALFGEDTPFVQVVNSFSRYQDISNALETDKPVDGISYIYEIYETARGLKSKITQWKNVHEEDSSESVKEKRNIINTIEEKLGVVKLHFRFKYDDLFKFEGEEVTLDPYKDKFTIKSISIQLLSKVPTALEGLKATAETVTLENKEINFKKISLISNGEEFKPFDGITITTPKNVTLEKEGEVYTLKIGKSKVDVTAGDIFELNTELSSTFRYNRANPNKVQIVDKLFFEEINVTLKDGVPKPFNTLEANATKVDIEANGDSYKYSFNEISVKSDEEFNPVSGIKFSKPSIKIKDNKDSTYEIDTLTKGFDITVGWVHANVIDGNGKFKYTSGNKANIEIKEIGIKEGTISFIGKAPDFIKDLTGTASDLSYANEKLDWNKITISTKPKTIDPFTGKITLTAPDTAEIESPNKNYKTTFKGAGAKAEILSDKIVASGKADFFVDSEGEKGIVNPQLSLNYKTDKVPGKIPPIWPLKVGNEIPMGPITVSFGVELDGGIQVTLKGDVKFETEKDALVFTAGGTVDGDISLTIKVGAGAGTSAIIYAGVFAKVTAPATATGEGGLNVKFKKSNNEFNLEKADLDYQMKAKLEATLSAGAEVKALFVFEKTLYEIKSKKVSLGESERKGEYSFKTEKSQLLSDGDGVFMGDKKALPNELNDVAEVKGSIESKEIENAVAIIKELRSENSNPEVLITKISELEGQIKLLKGRLKELKPFFRLGRSEKFDQIGKAEQLVDEILGGHLINFKQIATKKKASIKTEDQYNTVDHQSFAEKSASDTELTKADGFEMPDKEDYLGFDNYRQTAKKDEPGGNSAEAILTVEEVIKRNLLEVLYIMIKQK